MRNRAVVMMLMVAAAAALWWYRGRERAAEERAALVDGPSLTGVMTAGLATGASVPDARSKLPAELRGTVRVKGGGPLAGAQVCSSWWAEGVASQDRREPACATTDATGGYRLAALVPGNHSLTASAAGHVPQAWRAPRGEEDALELDPGQQRSGVDFALAPGGVEVKGVVSDINGGPIADARVSLASGAWWASATATTRADAQGRFALWAAPGPARVTAEAEGYADGEATAVAPARAVEVLLTPESSLAGIVVETGTREPVSDVLVEVADDGGDMRGFGGGATARTGADGRFRIDRLAPGRYKPTASGRGVYGEPADSVLLGLGQRVDEIVIEVHPTRVVSGRIEIVGAAGEAKVCTRGWVGLLGADSGRREHGSPDDDGKVELLSVRPGRYEVSVSCEGHLEQDRYEAITVADADVTGLVWKVGAGGTVRGVVRTAAGESVADVHVSAQTTGGAARAQRSWGSDQSREDGSFELTGLVAGDYTLRIWSDAHRAPEPGPKATVKLGEVTTTDVILEASGMVSGTVVDTDGKPVAGADIRVTGRYFVGGNSARSGEDGTFLLRGVEPGERRVVAARGWTDQLRRPGTTDDDVQGEKVTVVAGKTATVRLVVESRAGVITGKVQDDQGQPVIDAWVVASRESDAAGAQAGRAARMTRWSWGGTDRPVVTDVDGRFTVRELSPGTYTVRAFRRGGGEAVAEQVAAGGAVTLVIKAIGSLAGTVVGRGGTPLDELAVSVTDAKSGFERSESFYQTGGAFTMRDLPAGSFVVSVNAAAGRATQDVELAAGEQRAGLRFVLEAKLIVRGRIVDVVSGAPVVGLLAQITPRKGDDGRFMLTMNDEGERKHISDDEGRFEIDRAPPGKGYLMAIPLEMGEGDYGLVRYPVDVAAGAGVVDLGYIPAVKRRLKPGQPHGDLGLGYAEQPPDLEPEARQYKVSKVRAGGPAEAAGVKVGDVVVAVDGIDVRGARATLGWNLMAVPVGTKVVLGLARGASVTVTAGPPP